jgi:hypothetical protein
VREPRRRRLLPWLLLGAAVLAALFAAAGWRASAREGARLAGELAVSERALGRARERLAAHERHLGLIRDRVDTLLRDLGSLDALVARDPAATPKAADTPPTPAP